MLFIYQFLRVVHAHRVSSKFRARPCMYFARPTIAIARQADTQTRSLCVSRRKVYFREVNNGNNFLLNYIALLQNTYTHVTCTLKREHFGKLCFRNRVFSFLSAVIFKEECRHTRRTLKQRQQFVLFQNISV